MWPRKLIAVPAAVILLIVIFLLITPPSKILLDPENLKYSGYVDKFCGVDSDCVIGNTGFCGILCYPNENDVYNKETAEKISEWKGSFFKSGLLADKSCPVAQCSISNAIYVPKCASSLCIIERTPKI